jgi:hypothetical protein
MRWPVRNPQIRERLRLQAGKRLYMELARCGQSARFILPQHLSLPRTSLVLAAPTESLQLSSFAEISLSKTFPDYRGSSAAILW